jgi:transcriptional regulator
MYVPAPFAETDLAALDALVARDPFATLVTVVNGAPCVSHVPVLYARDGERVVFRGHWARANPQWRDAADRDALLIVRGPHAYISPSWYADKESAARVPTWNYAVAHISGTLEVFDDTDALASIVSDLSVRHETAIGSDWRFERERDDLRVQLKGIVGFSLEATRIQLKYKLNQNHPAANVLGAAVALERQGNPSSHEIAALMRSHLPRRQIQEN